MLYSQNVLGKLGFGFHDIKTKLPYGVQYFKYLDIRIDSSINLLVTNRIGAL